MNSLRLFNIALIVIVNFILPNVIYAIAAAYMSAIYALLLSAIPSFLFEMIFIILRKQIEITSLVVFICILLGILLAAFVKDAKLLMIKDSFSPFVFGILFLLSTLLKHTNLIWHYNMQFNYEDKELLLNLKNQWENDLYHTKRVTKCMCFVWGYTLLFESLLHLLLLFLVPIDTMKWLSLVVIVLIVIFLVSWTVLYTRYQRKKRISSETIQDSSQVS